MPQSIAGLSIAGGSIASLSIAAAGAADQGFTALFPASGSSWTFKPPKPGFWKFVGWGTGASGTGGVAGGASAGYFEVTRYMVPANTAVIVVGNFTTDTTVTFWDGKVTTAGQATGTTAGVATGGDVNLAGSAGVLSGVGNNGGGTGGGPGGPASTIGGAGAPANLPFHGGQGGSGGGIPGVAGHGGGSTDGGTPGPGLALAVFIHP